MNACCEYSPQLLAASIRINRGKNDLARTLARAKFTKVDFNSKWLSCFTYILLFANYIRFQSHRHYLRLHKLHCLKKMHQL